MSGNDFPKASLFQVIESGGRFFSGKCGHPENKNNPELQCNLQKAIYEPIIDIVRQFSCAAMKTLYYLAAYINKQESLNECLPDYISEENISSHEDARAAVTGLLYALGHKEDWKGCKKGDANDA